MTIEYTAQVIDNMRKRIELVIYPNRLKTFNTKDYKKWDYQSINYGAQQLWHDIDNYLYETAKIIRGIDENAIQELNNKIKEILNDYPTT